jgi:hypothetical protein
MSELKDILGVGTRQQFKLDGTNVIDIFPVRITDSGRPTSPQAGDITISGLTIRQDLWDEGDFETYEWELNHQYLDSGDCTLHARVHPTTDLAGTIELQYEFIIGKINPDMTISTRSGGTVTMTGTFTAGDATAGKGLYVTATISGSTYNLTNGEMLIGNITRNNNSYNDSVGMSEIGLHIPVGQTGENFS